MVKQDKYMLLAIGEFATSLANKISKSDRLVKDIGFTYDFALSSFDEFVDHDQDLDELKASTTGWYGIKTCDCGFDSSDMVVVSDYYGGGVAILRSIYEGEPEEDIRDEMAKEIIAVLDNGEGTTLSEDDIIFVEIQKEYY